MLQEPKPQGVHRYLGRSLLSADGEKIGTIVEFYYNRLTDVPVWMAVSAGILGSRKLIVPLAGSSFEDDEVRTPYTKYVISEEPPVEPGEALTPEAESLLSSYFGLGAEATSDASPD